jgi:hypothetical protein
MKFIVSLNLISSPKFCLLLESTHFKAPDGSENGKMDKNGLDTFYSGSSHVCFSSSRHRKPLY